MFDVWMRLLQAVDRQRAVAARGQRRRDAQPARAKRSARGIAAERLLFAPRMPLDEHLARHRLADLFLDTLPYNAHTTASDALWAGLPLVTCEGETFAGRVAGSLLRAVGLPSSSLAIWPATKRSRSIWPAIRRALRRCANGWRKTAASTRCSTPIASGRHLEHAYLEMWQRYQRGEPPVNLTIGTDAGYSR